MIRTSTTLLAAGVIFWCGSTATRLANLGASKVDHQLAAPWLERQPRHLSGPVWVPPNDAAEANGSTGGAEEENGRVDVYGNEIAPALAKYKLDPDGGLYELHSPHVQLPRLAPPKS